MSLETMIISLLSFTLLAGIAWALWQKVRTKKSQESSGDADGRKATQDALHAHKSDA